METSTLTVKESLNLLKADEHNGLTSEEAEKRFDEHGPNEIKNAGKVSAIKIFLSQFMGPLIWVLIAASIISALLDEWIDAIVIGAIVLINAVLGFFQEYRAERTIESLQKLAAPHSKVLRNGRVIEIESRKLVPGDIIFFETGDKIAADARVIDAVNLQAEEAALTGESLPSDKHAKEMPHHVPVADQSNIVFSGTIITRGRGKAVVSDTGMTSQFGKIAKMIQETPSEDAPLQRRMAVLAKWMGVAAIVVVLITFGIGVFKGMPMLGIFLTAVSLAVAVVPEGLPILITISLAFGVQRMAAKNALIRNLPSVETLGSVSVICTDKTGTLTNNEMTVRKIWVGRETIDVTGSGYSGEGVFTHSGKIIDAAKMPSLDTILLAGVLCNNTTITEDEGKREVIGDPTEAALLVSAEKAGFGADAKEKYPRLSEIEFTSERKRMSVTCNMDGKKTTFVKGAPDVLISRCDRVLIGGKTERLTTHLRDEITSANEHFARNAMRVLGFAYKESLHISSDAEETEHNMVFLGLQAMIDPPREEVKDAVAKCVSAGIKVVMITGDHKATAVAVAKEIGIVGEALTGEELSKISDDELEKVIEHVGVFARVDPEHKMKIVDAFKARNHIVAMTGDGINDAPALKKADIGIAMGVTGTAVAKEASKMILMDDNFASIVKTVEEGRTVFDNIKTFLSYLLSGNYGELLSVLIAISIGLPLPLFALQILWINVVTETIPATALSKEPPEHDVMARPPRKIGSPIFDKRDVMAIGATMLLIALGTLGVFYLSMMNSGWSFGDILDVLNPTYEYKYALTMAFVTFVFFQLFNIFNAKSPGHTIFFEELYNNKWMMVAVALTVGLQLTVVYTPLLNQVFSVVPLALSDWLLAVAVASSVLWAAEIIKLCRKITQKVSSHV